MTLSLRKKCWGKLLLLCLIIFSESAVLFAQAATTYNYVISAGDDGTPYSATALDGTFSVSVVGGSNDDNYKVREVHRPTISPYQLVVAFRLLTILLFLGRIG